MVLAVARPPVLLLLAMYAATGLAAAGGDPNSVVQVLPVLAVVAGFLVFSVCLNDLADAEIDRVNLPGRSDRLVVTGAAGTRQLVTIAMLAGLASLGTAALLGWRALMVCVAGLVISAAYSLPPVRLAKRGAVASLVLPACYVAVPFFVGALSATTAPGTSGYVLLAALYVGFVGRILLKDFRDLRGDALFGKRTFLVRHGRRATCAFSAIAWSLGTALTVLALTLGGPVSPALVVSYGAGLAGAVALLRALSVDRGHRRDELIISAVAIVGRGQLLALLAVLSMTARSGVLVAAVVGGIVAVTARQAYLMLRCGRVMRHSVPSRWTAEMAGVASAEGRSRAGRIGVTVR